jgi:membrane protease subunit (stomatin/prohibitin family)
MPAITLTTLQSLKQKGEKITMLTCYDATFAHACNEALEEQWHHIVGISIEQAPIEGVCCLMEDERRRLHEEEREHRSLASAMRKERQAQENRRREPERDHRAHRRIASRIQATPSFHSTCNI